MGYTEAEKLQRATLESRERVLGGMHPDTLASLNNLALLLQTMGKYDEAEKLQRRALEGREAVLGPDHPDTIQSLNNLNVQLQRSVAAPLGKADALDVPFFAQCTGACAS